MRIRVLLTSTLAAGLTAAALLAPAGPADAGAAAAQCTYTPVLPKRVVVTKDTVNFRTGVRITAAGGADCTSVFQAQERLSHKGDDYTLAWDQTNRTSSDAVFAITVKPGTYTTSQHSCLVPTSAAPTCAVGDGSTIIKFGGSAHISGTRGTGKHKTQVRLSVSVTHYKAYSTAYVSTPVAIQRHSTSGWHTVHTATTHGSSGYTWTTTDAHSASYRAVATESSSTFAATSRTIAR